MSFGIPCDTEPQPQQVFVLVQQIDTSIASFVEVVANELLRLIAEMEAALAYVVQTLTRSVSARTSRIDTQINEVYSALQQITASLQAKFNVDLSTALTGLASSLAVPPEQLLEIAPGQVPIGRAVPPAPTVLGDASPVVVAPVQVSLTLNGAPVNVTTLVPPLPQSTNVSVAGVSYTPTFGVYRNETYSPTKPDGSPNLTVSLDKQQDGSAVVTVGPISVHVALPHAGGPEAGPACPLNTEPLVS